MAKRKLKMNKWEANYWDRYELAEGLNNLEKRGRKVFQIIQNTTMRPYVIFVVISVSK